MTVSSLRIEDDARVRLITFTRPDARNAFNNEQYHACADALERAAADRDIACVVFTGEGSAFSAGQDLAEMQTLGSRDRADDAAPSEHGFSRFLGQLEAFPKPVIAAVNGVAVGLGLTMLPHCDIVLVARGARLRAPFARLGVVPEAGSSYTLPRVMGPQRAALALYTSDWISADEAVQCGLALELCEPDDLLPRTLEIARAIARMPVISLVETKRLLLANTLEHARAARAREEEVFSRVTMAPANREAIAAFLEKREPDFTNLPE